MAGHTLRFLEEQPREEGARRPVASRSADGVRTQDVLIVGAGLSGIGAACICRRIAPGASAILEASDAIGGT
jgi:ribulose 1,5-bisphosphate synthetase/thiazole synthase